MLFTLFIVVLAENVEMMYIKLCHFSGNSPLHDETLRAVENGIAD